MAFEYKSIKPELSLLHVGDPQCSTVNVDVKRGNETLKLTVNTHDPAKISYTVRTQENGKWWDCVKSPYSVSSYSKDQTLRVFLLNSVKSGAIPTLTNCEHHKN